MPFLLVAVLGSIAVLNIACSSTPAGSHRIDVAAGSHDRRDCPVVIDLPEPLAASAWLSLEAAGGNVPVPVQRLTGEPARAVFLLDELPAGETRSYYLSAGDPDADPHVTATDSEREITLRVGDKPVLAYNRSVLEPPEGVDSVFRSSGFIHPVYTPSGKIITDAYPADHLHQHAIFFSWVRAVFEGRSVDFWNQAEGAGTTEHFTINDIRSGDVFAGLTVVRRYIDKTAPAGPKAALEETWTIHCYAVDDGFLFDIESEQRTATTAPLTVNEYHYGGMAVRGAAGWTKGSGVAMLTSEGKDRVEGNHTRPVWLEMNGPVESGSAGILAMDHAGNFHHPQPVRLHPTMPYFCFAPMVIGEFQINAGELYVTRYRFHVHDGGPDPENNDRLWHDYSDPPAVTIR